MKSIPALEEIMEAHGAQGHIAVEFIQKARVIYRRKGKKRIPGEPDMIIGTNTAKVLYHRVDVAQLLDGFNIVVYNPEDPPEDIIQRTLHLRSVEELNFSPMRYDRKRRKFFISVVAVKHSNVYVGGGRVYLHVTHWPMQVSCADLSSVMQMPL